jgi:uncharacterized protein (TIGR02266 family)
MVDDDDVPLSKAKELESELEEVRRALSERDRTIQLLAKRLESLESERAPDGSIPETPVSVPPTTSAPPAAQRSRESMPSTPSVPSTPGPTAGRGSPSAFAVASVVPLASSVPSVRIAPAVPVVAPAMHVPAGDSSPDSSRGSQTLDQIHWHSVTVGRRASQPPDSIPPSQRKDPRRAVELQIEFNEDTQFFAGLTQDISEGGVFIATYRILPIGTPLTLSFELPDATKVTARGEVRWVRDTNMVEGRPGMGVSFTDLTPESLAAISRFCRHNAPLYVEF